jgi:hypothetical protein
MKKTQPKTTSSSSENVKPQFHAAEIVSRNDGGFTVQLIIPYSNSMLNSEELIQERLNEAGIKATQEILSRFDTDGTPIQHGATTFFSKGKEPKEYQTPYGATVVERHVYQTAKGGKTFCPLEHDARIIITSTPKFAKTVSSKYADLGGSRVQADLKENHGRNVARSYIQNIAEAVSAVVEAKEDTWKYHKPTVDKKVSTISIGLDGAMMFLCQDGYREAMVGTIALYDSEGNRQHTNYIAASPEYGKETFLTRLASEVVNIKADFPKANYVGVADGAKSNWSFLEQHTDTQTIDFWHATEYLATASGVMFRGKKRLQEKAEWLDQACHKLKHTVGGAARLWNEMKAFDEQNSLPQAEAEKLETVITYFGNNKGKMRYAKSVKQNLPIGSGVTEAACKVIVKQRMCGSAMKWKENGAAAVLRLRCLNYSTGRWDQFWNKVNQYGLPMAA